MRIEFLLLLFLLQSSYQVQVVMLLLKFFVAWFDCVGDRDASSASARNAGNANEGNAGCDRNASDSKANTVFASVAGECAKEDKLS